MKVCNFTLLGLVRLLFSACSCTEPQRETPAPQRRAHTLCSHTAHLQQGCQVSTCDTAIKSIFSALVMPFRDESINNLCLGLICLFIRSLGSKTTSVPICPLVINLEQFGNKCTEVPVIFNHITLLLNIVQLSQTKINTVANLELPYPPGCSKTLHWDAVVSSGSGGILTW